MSLVIKRVSVDSNYIVGDVWLGYTVPLDLRPEWCQVCNHTGYNKETLVLYEDLYKGKASWRNEITEDEYAALVDADAFNGWNGSKPTLDDFNSGNVVFDSFMTTILLKTRATRLGIFGRCGVCNGAGLIWRDTAHVEAFDAWQPQEIPVGPLYQVWEMTYDLYFNVKYTARTPAFETEELLFEYINQATNEPWGVWTKDIAAHILNVQ